MEIIEKIEPIFKGMDIKGYKVKMLSNERERTLFFRNDSEELKKILEKYHKTLLKTKANLTNQLSQDNTLKYIFYINGGVSIILFALLVYFGGRFDASLIRHICLSILGISFGSSLFIAPNLNKVDKKNIKNRLEDIEVELDECVDMKDSVKQFLERSKENMQRNDQRDSEIRQERIQNNEVKQDKVQNSEIKQDKVQSRSSRKFQPDTPSFLKNLNVRSNLNIELIREASRIDSISPNPIKIKASANNIGNYKKSDERDKNNSRIYQDKKTQISFDGNLEEVMGVEYSSRRR